MEVFARGSYSFVHGKRSFLSKDARRECDPALLDRLQGCQDEVSELTDRQHSLRTANCCFCQTAPRSKSLFHILLKC